jgi:[protein-PII] uridylyltransferase
MTRTPDPRDQISRSLAGPPASEARLPVIMNSRRPRAPRVEDIVDGRKLRIMLTAAALDYEGDEAAQRKRVLDLLHGALFRGRLVAQDFLESGGGGLATARILSGVMDEVLAALFDYTSVHLFRARNPTEGERLAVMAVGGYGRSTLAPSSDVDLLFLRPYKQTPWAESVIESMLYMLWDMGLKVGHAFRTIDECIRLAKQDVTIRTALLDGRHLFGDATLSEQLHERYQQEIVRGHGADFIAAKLKERDARHARGGGTRYLVEPNVKESKGAIRDLDTLYWLVKFTSGQRNLRDIARAKALSPYEVKSFRKTADFLWTVRCHLHFLTGRAEERLSFDLQPEMAARLGYFDRAGLLGVERFMKRYFLISKEVGSLSRLISSRLEAAHHKKPADLARYFSALKLNQKSVAPGFRLEGNALNIVDEKVLSEHPINLLRLFHLADRLKVDVHANALMAATRHARLAGSALRKEPEAQALFLDLMTSRNGPHHMLALMNEADVLGRFVPEFGRIVAQTQFNMYHHYTVDEHTLRAVEAIGKIEAGDYKAEHPLSTEVMPKIQSRRALYLAMLLHDTGKGQGDQQIEGAKSARTACLRLGLDASEAELVAWLVGNHLMMSETAQRRDTTDPRTIEKFAQLVGSLERLRLLLVLTVADIRAVGPGIWNSWKGQLLRDLYHGTEAALRGERSSEQAIASRLAERSMAARGALATALGGALPNALKGLDTSYWSSTSPDAALWHGTLLRGLPRETVLARMRVNPVHGTSELIVHAPDRSGLFADIAAAISSVSANIIAAQAHTSDDDRAIDLFALQDTSGAPYAAGDEPRARLLELAVEAAASGKSVPSVPQTRASRRASAFVVEPSVRIDNKASLAQTVIEVSGRDRPGLLALLLRVLTDNGAEIDSAYISAFGETVSDVFYVHEEDRSKIESARRQKALTEQLLATLWDTEIDAPTTPARRALARAKASGAR